MDYRVYLKVKIKSLAEEARIIKKEEKRKGPNKKGLYLHRIFIVRVEARHTLLAYNFIRGRTYKQTEVTNKPIDLKKVTSMIKQYGIQRDWTKDTKVWMIQKEDELKRLDAWLREN